MRRAFSLIEVLVVCGILVVLLSILLPVISRARGQAKLTQCQSNLRQISHAFQQYIAANKGWVPRRWPVWVHKVMNELVGRGTWLITDLRKNQVLQCPVHPDDRVPTGFTLNVFAFDSQPNWKASPPIQASLIRNASKLPWLLEIPDSFGEFDCGGVYDGIYFEECHIAYSPIHLPGGSKARISYTRHGRRANVLFFDGHVDVVRPGQLQLEAFDDGVRSRNWD